MSEKIQKSEKDTKKEDNKKAVAVLVVALIAFGWMCVSFTKDKAKNQAPTKEQQGQTQALSNLTEDKKIEKVLNDLLSGQTNANVQKLKSIQVRETKTKEYEVLVQIRTDQGINQKMTNREIKRSISEVLQALYTNNLKVSSATVSVFAQLVDKYGKQFEGSVYTATLEANEASKINWQTDKDTLISSIIPSVWQTGIVNPDFRD